MVSLGAPPLCQARHCNLAAVLDARTATNAKTRSSLDAYPLAKTLTSTENSISPCLHNYNIVLSRTKQTFWYHGQALAEQGTHRCFRFNDRTKPVCGAEGQLGHLCRPCCRQNQAAQALLDSESPRARWMLLRLYCLLATSIFSNNKISSNTIYYVK